MIGTEIFTNVVDAYLPQPHAALLNGIVLGKDLTRDTAFYVAVQRVGLLHLVVLSGMNISLLGMMVDSCTRPLGKKISLICTIVAIVLFILFVGLDPPVTRAAVMGIIGLVGMLYGRKSYALYTLVLSVIVIAVCKPEWLTSVSMHLSTGATLGIILFGKVGESSRLKPQSAFGRYMYDELAISLAASVFTVPIIFWKFQQISFIAPLANAAVSWVVAPLMIVGILTSVLGKVHPILGLPFAYLSYGMLDFIVKVVYIGAAVPFTYLDFHGR